LTVLLIEFREWDMCSNVPKGENDKQPGRVGNILPGLLKGLGLDRKMEEVRLFRRWPEIVGAAIASRSRPREIKRGELVIEVENNVWMQEIRFHENAIIERVAKEFPRIELSGIRLTLKKERGTGK
jgi:predicted nucleic acid-binding Zn ribbon protein